LQEKVNLPDVILLDINLSKFYAFDLITLFKSKGFGEIPIFLITSSIFSEDVMKANLEPMVKGIFKKPFMSSQASQILNSVA
jgi:CheY-like chemotaxis protein